jgi:hypothetical protein
MREAARLAEDHIRSTIAWALGLDSADLWVVTVAPSSGQVYAATVNALYVLYDRTSWQQVSFLPDAPTALVAGGPAGQVVYLGTIASGPYRSLDGGQTWQWILNGLPFAERLTVTALALNPESQSAQQIYMALGVTVGTSQLHTTPLGIFRSDDGGETWVAIDYLSTRLIIDPATPNYLYGLTEVGAWQTALPQ